MDKKMLMTMKKETSRTVVTTGVVELLATVIVFKYPYIC